MQHFNRERVPKRVAQAKGSAAHGFFEATADVTQWTNAAFRSKVGKRTPVAVRFSTVAGELGSADTVRDPRGFAMKFYTDDGDYDLVGNNTPVFFIRDAPHSRNSSTPRSGCRTQGCGATRTTTSARPGRLHGTCWTTPSATAWCSKGAHHE